MLCGFKSWLYFFFKRTGALASWIATLNFMQGCDALGSRPADERRARMERSPQWVNGHFDNPQPLHNSLWSALTGYFKSSAYKIPDHPLPVIKGDRTRFTNSPASGLRITWLGHSSILIEIDGYRILTDPVWGERTSPLTWLGPKRWYEPPIALDQLPPLDAVIISHDHYDHLDYPTIMAMKDWKTRFITPLGVGAHLVGWGIPEERITEMDWWDKEILQDLEIVCTPARHASGRALVDNGRTLWAGYALISKKHRVYFSGDTGLFPGLKDIGDRLGPFDVTMIEAGAYHKSWPDWHIGPEQAVVAHQMVKGRIMMPIHWGLFSLAFHGWTEPVERVLVAAKKAGTTTIIPRPGESIEPETAATIDHWWPSVPWETAEQSPIISTRMND